MRPGIVTSFVTNNDKILILRRSSMVGMSGLWAGVSGRIEDGEEPLHRAKTEIFEETGMTENDIALIAESGMIPVESHGCRWEVFPFLFEARDPGIRLNWENSEYRWIDAGELVGYETVPDLQRVLASLL
ncbi:MAG: NUDIX domain-containing protein [Nitrosopumilus sp. H13]|nr:MAG: NUDIX domain-containing protein [Nitrosopumilus sp. H13]